MSRNYFLRPIPLQNLAPTGAESRGKRNEHPSIAGPSPLTGRRTLAPAIRPTSRSAVRRRRRGLRGIASNRFHAFPSSFAHRKFLLQKHQQQTIPIRAVIDAMKIGFLRLPNHKNPMLGANSCSLILSKSRITAASSNPTIQLHNGLPLR